VDNSSTKDDVPESFVEVHGVGDGVVPLQGDHSCNIKRTVSRERKKRKIDQKVALQGDHSCNIEWTVSRER
jgi:hypothetical protein